MWVKYNNYVIRNREEDLFKRSNFDGHITGSALIINDNGEILLLYHNALQKWLQPGGHIDAEDDSVIMGAFREVEEETGLQSNNLELIPAADNLTLFDIDSHPIPANAKKGEDAHVHHDARYLLRVKKEVAINIDELESGGFKWVKLEDITHDETMGRGALKILHFLKKLSH